VHTRIGFLGVLLVLVAGTPVVAQQRFSDLAPADEYFGRMKMSILGISNTIHDAGVHLDAGANPTIVANSLAWAEDAIGDWSRRYPRDPWIPRSLAALRLTYARIPTPWGQESARRVAVWLRDFPAK